MRVITITFVAISTCYVWCETNKAKGTKDGIEYWKPDYKFEENKKRKTKDANDKPNFRQRDVKPKSKTARITKMQLLQREGTTKSSNRQSEEDNAMYEYLSPYSIKQELVNLVKKIPNTNVTIDVIGRTVEYNDIVLLKITEDKAPSDKYFRAVDGKYAEDLPEKKIIFIVHGLSAMGITELEALSHPSDFLILLSYYVAHLYKFDIFLIPMANPDGVAWSRVSSFWNKNASPQSDCPGVALDRNFDIAWNSNRSINSCHQDYPGSAPFSEEETRAIRDVFHKYSHKIVAYLNVHANSYSYVTFKGDAVLYPKGYSDSVSDDDKYIDLKGEIEEALRNASFRIISVTVDTIYSWYGKVTGSSVDYASTVYGVPFALELLMQSYLDPVVGGMETPPSYIDSALGELWRRVIDVIFNYIWRTLEGNEVQ